HEPEEGMTALNDLQDNDLDGLPTRRVLEEARALGDRPAAVLPSALLERLNPVEAQLVTGIAAEAQPPAPPFSCVRELQQLRVERELTSVQREIDRLQELGRTQYDAQITELWHRKSELFAKREELGRVIISGSRNLG